MSTLEKTIFTLVKKALTEVIEQEKQSGTFTQVTKPIYRPSEISKEKEYDPLSIIRPNELSKILSISKPTLYRLQNEGKLPPKIEIGRSSVGWLRKDIEEWLLQRRL